MSKISDQKTTSQPLSDEELEKYVKDVLEPMINEFAENHKGRKITKSDIEGLYKNLSNNLIKDPKIMHKHLDRTNTLLEEMASATANEIQKDQKLSISAKLIRGFSDFCNNIGLEAIGTACLKLIKKDTNLIGQLDKIAKDVKSTKISITVGNSESTKRSTPIAQPKIGSRRI